MATRFPLCFLLVAVLPAPLSAQEWAEKMFAYRSYDFGKVARSAKTEYAFEITNLYLEDVHISGVRSSCGCTTPRIENDTLKTYEKGAVIAHINSDRVLGNQGATITVTIDRPQYAQVQLHVRVYVYNEVLLEPSSVLLGSVAQGHAAGQTIRVQYSGPYDWRIAEVRSAHPNLQGAVTEIGRQPGRIAYDLKVTLDKTAPLGYLKDYVWLVTNDANTHFIPVPVEGLVHADVLVSPATLFLGVVNPGQSVTRQIVVRSQKPLRITAVRLEGQGLKATVPKDQSPQSLHLLPVTFTAGEKPGPVTHLVQIKTDAGPEFLSVPVYAVIGSP